MRGFLKLREQDQCSYKIEGSLRIAAGDSLPSHIAFVNEGTLDVKKTERNTVTSVDCLLPSLKKQTKRERGKRDGLSTLA